MRRWRAVRNDKVERHRLNLALSRGIPHQFRVGGGVPTHGVGTLTYNQMVVRWLAGATRHHPPLCRSRGIGVAARRRYPMSFTALLERAGRSPRSVVDESR